MDVTGCLQAGCDCANHPFYFMSDDVHDIIYKCMYIHSVRVLVQLCARNTLHAIIQWTLCMDQLHIHVQTRLSVLAFLQFWRMLQVSFLLFCCTCDWCNNTVKCSFSKKLRMTTYQHSDKLTISHGVNVNVHNIQYNL